MDGEREREKRWIFIDRFFSSRTALHWAAKRNHSQVVGFLLSKGANRDIQAHDQSIPVHVCTDDSLRVMLQSTTSNSKRLSLSLSSFSTDRI